ncbi:alpha/beta fold hydrolase [Thermaurantiacus sp.]
MAEPPALPPDGIVGTLEMADGIAIRNFLLPRAEPAARLLLLNGRADFLEKWARLFAELHVMGFALAAFDWRGQGGSAGKPANGAGHIRSFELWLHDLDQLVPWARQALGGEVLLLGHSLGGHLALRWLCDGRGTAPALLLTAPFCGFAQPALVTALIAAVARRRVRQGRGEDYALSQKPWGAHRMAAARAAILTSDPLRFADEGAAVAANPALGLGGVSWGWLAAAEESLARLRAGPLERLAVPTLMLLAEREHLVSNRAARAIAARLPDCQVEEVEGAAHEILREADAPRRHALSRIMAFAARHAP